VVPDLSVQPDRPLRLGLLDDVHDPRVHGDVRDVVLAAVEQLRAGGVEVVEVDGSALRALLEPFGPIVLHEAWMALGPLRHSDPGHFGPDTDRLLLAGEQVSADDYDAALAMRDRLVPAAEALLEGLDALIGPVVAFTAPESTPVLDSPGGEIEGLFTEPANLTGQPALSLPAGLAADGLPVGLQLTGRRGGDGDLLLAAARVERLLAAPAPTLEDPR
jgi:Asp-tRNA(Asn)/Glu-tRNA(Gln) amidotransferase A subunit family amidase